MTPENRNLIMAVALSMVVLLGWQILVIQPEMEREAVEQERIAAEMAKSGAASQTAGQPSVSTANGNPTVGESASPPRAGQIAKRVVIDAPLVRGSFSVRGARLDDVILTGYKETLDDDSDNIHFCKKPTLRGRFLLNLDGHHLTKIRRCRTLIVYGLLIVMY